MFHSSQVRNLLGMVGGSLPRLDTRTCLCYSTNRHQVVKDVRVIVIVRQEGRVVVKLDLAHLQVEEKTILNRSYVRISPAIPVPVTVVFFR
jgi:hypothetical protein